MNCVTYINVLTEAGALAVDEQQNRVDGRSTRSIFTEHTFGDYRKLWLEQIYRHQRQQQQQRCRYVWSREGFVYGLRSATRSVAILRIVCHKSYLCGVFQVSFSL